ncbi:hypothetical protein NC653_011408 [Populus alba x Populus x berolinensis]|uniref:Histone H4 n=2 Tax=Populus TaxID=3689 RepID=A0A4U5NST3_POPAL|nr:hypothetical protein NC653_027921 [Populus alba x Populus x berolinensis]KAJ6996661.1 hypothetical protein NC653_013306 [Populus alba x Populus x berolinensis]KAJ7000940.1 hypothetical protein NC653_011408 [Populus alba x Populus x berolinensis]TKR86210.1 hypothetical protein D5086_0000241130 [Populus alba]
MFLGKNLYKVKLNRNPFPSEWASLAIEEESTTGERGEVLPITGLRALREHKSCLEHGTRETRSLWPKTVTVMDVVYALKRQGRTLYGFGGLVTKQRITDEDEIYLAVVVKMKTPERWRRLLGKMKMETISGK